MSICGYIYKYTYSNGKIYIGQTRVSIQKRHAQHMFEATHNNKCKTLCEKAIQKYGEPLIEIIETIEVNEDEVDKLILLLNEAEIKWIHYYDSTNINNGYNIQLGGEYNHLPKKILEAEWYNLYKKYNCGEHLAYIKDILNAVIKKNGIDKDGKIIPFHLKSSDLTKDERKILYGLTFKIHNEYTTTFIGIIKRFNGFDYIDNIIEYAFDNYIEDIRQKLWKQIMNKQDKIIKIWYKKNI